MNVFGWAPGRSPTPAPSPAPQPRFRWRFVSKFMHELPISIVPKLSCSSRSLVRPLFYLHHGPCSSLRPPAIALGFGSAPFSSRLVIVAGVPVRALNCFIMLDVIMPAVQFAAGRGSIPSHLPTTVTRSGPLYAILMYAPCVLFPSQLRLTFHSLALFLSFFLSFSVCF